MDKEEQAELASTGSSIKMLPWLPRATYYKPNGEAIHNLPADPYSMPRYLKRGFTLEPPKKRRKV